MNGVHWAEQYIGQPYNLADCAALAVQVQAEIFGKQIQLPSNRENNIFGISRQIRENQTDAAEETQTPQEGDAVLMIGRGRLNHIGVYCQINDIAYVLHSMRHPGHACLHKLTDLDKLGFSIEGFYRWK